MIPVVEHKRAELVDLCRHFKVDRLHLFGSGATSGFAEDRSDLDFLVRFANRQPSGEYADRYLDFADELERLFQRPVDLVTEESIRNPYFQSEIDATRQLIYEHPRQEAIA